MQNPAPLELVAQARNAARFTYSPYSHFPVGAALLCADGSVVTGAKCGEPVVRALQFARNEALCSPRFPGQDDISCHSGILSSLR